MSLKDELEKEVGTIFKSVWTERAGTVVPDDTSLTLGNDAVKLNATVLYADLADSTQLVDGFPASFAAETYKTFLYCAAKIIRSQEGVITAYDGDRIMAVFIGKTKNTSAVKAALKIHFAVEHLINPARQSQYPVENYVLRHVVGIDTSDLLVAKTGARRSNDLVWVGRAANYAAKLATLPETHQTYITKQVFDIMNEEVKLSDGGAMWEPVSWDTFDNRTIYRSNYWWRID